MVTNDIASVTSTICVEDEAARTQDSEESARPLSETSIVMDESSLGVHPLQPLVEAARSADYAGQACSHGSSLSTPQTAPSDMPASSSTYPELTVLDQNEGHALSDAGESSNILVESVFGMERTRQPHSSSRDVVRSPTGASSCSLQGSLSHPSDDNVSSRDEDDDIATRDASLLQLFKGTVCPISPPVRLRMTSADKLCPRAMVVEWEDGGLTRRRWLSSKDPLQSGWFEAEKLLPPSATNITVQFQVRGPRKRWDVCMVDRHRGCQWVMLGKDRHAKEIFCFRVGAGRFVDPIDVTFELKGAVHRCCVHRAWNAARLHPPEEWEFWDDDETRPPSEGSPSTLIAANAAGMPQECSSPDDFLEISTRRLVAAALVVLDVHRETLRALQGLDASCTGQWYRANLSTTGSAALLVAAVPATILLPPLGLALAIAGSVASTAAMGGASLEERWTLARLRRQLSQDSWNAFVAAELLCDWLKAKEAVRLEWEQHIHSEHSSKGYEIMTSQVNPWVHAAVYAADTAAGATVKTVATFIAITGEDLAKVMPFLGPAGLIVSAVLTTGVALHGWTTRKFSQNEVRGKIAELRQRIYFFQCLLAKLGFLECAICARGIFEDDLTRCCKMQYHFCHADCASIIQQCSECGSTFQDGDPCSIADLVKEIVKKSSTDLDEDPSVDEGIAECKSKRVVDVEDFWQLLDRLDAVSVSMSSPIRCAEDAERIGVEIGCCWQLLMEFKQQAYQQADGSEPKLCDLTPDIIQMAERVAGVMAHYELWSGQCVDMHDLPIERGEAVDAQQLLQRGDRREVPMYRSSSSSNDGPQTRFPIMRATASGAKTKVSRLAITAKSYFRKSSSDQHKPLLTDRF